MKNNLWLACVKNVLVFMITVEIVFKHIINWQVDDKLLSKYKNVMPYLYYSKSEANKFMYNHVFLKDVVDSASEKAKGLLYKLNPHKYWNMKPEESAK